MIAARFVTTCDLCDMWGRKSHEQGWRWWPWGEDEDEDEDEGENEDDDDDDGDAYDADDADVADVAAADDDDDGGGVVMWWCVDVDQNSSKYRKQQVRSEGQSWKFRVSSFQSRHGAVFAHPQPQNWRTPYVGKWCLDQSGV